MKTKKKEKQKKKRSGEMSEGDQTKDGRADARKPKDEASWLSEERRTKKEDRDQPGVTGVPRSLDRRVQGILKESWERNPLSTGDKRQSEGARV